MRRADIAAAPPASADSKATSEQALGKSDADTEIEEGGDVEFDDRVMNIPKVMRISYHNENPYWREAAISTVNFWVRYVDDLQAIFNTYFAGTPNWDGDCRVLPGRHALGYEAPSSAHGPRFTGRTRPTGWAGAVDPSSGPGTSATGLARIRRERQTLERAPRRVETMR